MNERQRDLFLYLWSQRRKPGRAMIGLRGLAIGALGGFVFALIMSQQGHSPGIHAYETGRLLIDSLRWYVLSIPPFALIGWAGADRVFAAQEAQYQALLASGARVPEQKPAMQPSDRWPAVAVGVVAAAIAAFIVALFIAYW